MRHLQQLTIWILAAIFGFNIISGFRSVLPSSSFASSYSQGQKIDLKQNALAILKLKCNGCHRRQNPSWMFTTANINSLAPKIYEQVFVRKRMPRGKKVSLTDDEYKTLWNWLNSESLIK